MTLNRKLLLTLSLGFAAVLGAELLTRANFELPVQYELEEQADRDAMDQAGIALKLLLVNYERLVVDWSAWDDTFFFIHSEPGTMAFKAYQEANLSIGPHRDNNVNGYVFMNKLGEEIFSTGFDLDNGEAMPPLDTEKEGLSQKLRGIGPGQLKNRVLLNSGFMQSEHGPLLFATGLILRNSGAGEPAGTLTVWRLFDEGVFRQIREFMQTDMQFIAITAAGNNPLLKPIVDELESGARRFLPRGKGDRLYWRLMGVEGKPLFLISQQAQPRKFNDALISGSVLVAAAMSSLILLIIALLASRNVISPLIKAGSLMREIAVTGDYTQRLAADRRDELGGMYSCFNQLLSQIEIRDRELMMQNEQLENLSQQDALTGIHNRRYFDETMGLCWRQSMRSQHPVSVLMIDVDHFKAFNDNYGHQSGDRVLKLVAATLQANLHRATDHLARYGGEEFCAILMNTAAGEALAVAERLRSAIEELQIRHEFSPTAEVLTVSIGASTADPHDKLVQLDLIKAADLALYEVKATQRNSVQYYSGANDAGKKILGKPDNKP